MKKRLAYTAAAFIGTMAASTPVLAAGEEIELHICPLCGICPAPFNICLFPVIIGILAIAIIIITAKGSGKRCPLCHAKCKKEDVLCHKCGYDFESRLQSTMAIRVEDSPELMALREAANDLSANTAEFSIDEINEKLAEQESVIQEAVVPESPIEMKRCPVCGAELPKVAMFCGKCGRKLEE